MKVTAVVSTKGGPGKTTVGVNLGAFCADAGIRKFKDMAATAPPAVANMLNMLIAENYGFQNDLAGVTSGTVAELLATKLGLSPERAAELVVAVRLGVAAFNAAKAVAVVVGKAGGGGQNRLGRLEKLQARALEIRCLTMRYREAVIVWS